MHRTWTCIHQALLKRKEARTLEILTGPYAGTDLLFLQERPLALAPSPDPGPSPTP
jgi:hypothetical protein